MALIGKHVRKESRYTAILEKAMINGHRTIHSLNGNVYTGEWKRNKRDGIGTQKWVKSGLMYEGEWVENKREGHGVLKKMSKGTGEDIILYIGTWKNDKKDGNGTYYYNSGKYEGDWKENERSGFGKMIYDNGDVYEGQWLHDKPHGNGLQTTKNGMHIYEGSMRDGMKHGYGKSYTLTVYEGIWENDEAKSGTTYKETVKDIPMPQLKLKDGNALQEGAQNRSLTDEQFKRLFMKQIWKTE